MSEIAKLVPTKSDKEKADEFKAQAVEAAKSFMEVLTRANREGFKFQISFGENPFGEVVITQLMLVKQF